MGNVVEQPAPAGTGLVRGLNWLSLAFVVLAVGGDALFLGVGTLFFDDPHADYGQFVRAMAGAGAFVVAAGVVCFGASRLLLRRGWPRTAALVASLPAPVCLAGLTYVAG